MSPVDISLLISSAVYLPAGYLCLAVTSGLNISKGKLISYLLYRYFGGSMEPPLLLYIVGTSPLAQVFLLPLVYHSPGP